VGPQGINGYDGNLVGTIIAWPSVTPPTGYLLCDGSAQSRTTYAQLFSVVGTSFGAGDGATTFNLPDLRSKMIIGVGQGTSLTNRTLAMTGGEETHVLSLAELAAHAHNGGNHQHLTMAHGHGWNDGNHSNLAPVHGHGWTNNGHTHTVAADSATRTGVTQGSYGSFGTVQTSTTSGENQVVGSVQNAGQFWCTGLNVVCGSIANSANAWTDTDAARGGVATDTQGSSSAHNVMAPFLCLTYCIRASYGVPQTSPTVPMADTTQPGLVTKMSGLTTDYVGGDNTCHNLAAVAATAFKGFVSKTAAYTVSPADSGYYIICSGGSWTLTLPPAAAGLNYLVRNDNPGITAIGGVITIATSGTNTINGAASIQLLAQQECTIVTDGTNWRTIGLAREVVLGSLNLSAATSQVIFFPAGYTYFDLQITRLLCNTGTPNMQIQTSLDGTTYITTGYYGVYWYDSSTTVLTVGTYNNGTSLYITHWLEQSARHLVNHRIHPGDAGSYFSFSGQSGGMYNSSGFVGTFTLSGFGTNAGRMVSMNLFLSAGTFSGAIIVKGVV
jgi:microcystin-dependent protein